MHIKNYPMHYSASSDFTWLSKKHVLQIFDCSRWKFPIMGKGKTRTRHFKDISTDTFS